MKRKKCSITLKFWAVLARLWVGRWGLTSCARSTDNCHLSARINCRQLSIFHFSRNKQHLLLSKLPFTFEIHHHKKSSDSKIFLLIWDLKSFHFIFLACSCDYLHCCCFATVNLSRLLLLFFDLFSLAGCFRAVVVAFAGDRKHLSHETTYKLLIESEEML